MESQQIFSTGVSLCSRIPLSIRALSGAAAHPWSCLPQHGGVRGCVHQTCHHGPRQLPMPGFPTAHQKQVRAVLSLRRLLWICSRAGYRRRGTGVGTVPHGLGGEPGLRREGRVRNTTARGRPLSAPRSSAWGLLPPRTPALFVVTLGGFEIPVQSRDEAGPKTHSLMHKATWKDCPDTALSQSGSLTSAALGERPYGFRVVKDGPCGCFLVQLIN